jgi:hypothetical protein
MHYFNTFTHYCASIRFTFDQLITFVQLFLDMNKISNYRCYEKTYVLLASFHLPLFTTILWAFRKYDAVKYAANERQLMCDNLADDIKLNIEDILHFKQKHNC